MAARLWSGATLNDVGMPIDPGSLVRLPPPRMVVSPAGPASGSVEAEVLWVDRFGNAQLAAGATEATLAGLDGVVEVRVGTATRRARLVTSFAALEDDEVGLMVDANGRLSLVCRRPAGRYRARGADGRHGHRQPGPGPDAGPRGPRPAQRTRGSVNLATLIEGTRPTDGPCSTGGAWHTLGELRRRAAAAASGLVGARGGAR